MRLRPETIERKACNRARSRSNSSTRDCSNGIERLWRTASGRKLLIPCLFASSARQVFIKASTQGSDELNSRISNQAALMSITMASVKGGVGKSTSAVYLAAELAKIGKTLLVDGDPNRSVTRWASQGHLPFTVVSESQATPGRRSTSSSTLSTRSTWQEDLTNLRS